MAITEEQIFAAAAAIKSTSKSVTSTAVRRYLGTGSYSTITPALRRWEETQAPPTVAASPVEAPQAVIDCLMVVAPQIWSIAAQVANSHLAAERTTMDIERNELQTALADSASTGELIAADLEAAQAQILNLSATVTTLTADHAVALAEETAARIAVEQAAAVLRATNDQLQTRIDKLCDENREAKAEIGSLKVNLAAQATAAHVAENRLAAAEATVAAQTSQIIDLHATEEQLRADIVRIRIASTGSESH